jgi:ATP-dependent exoDNAse (exonuclease V) alpha subunit
MSNLQVSSLSEADLKIAFDNCLLDINDILRDGGKSINCYDGFAIPENDTRNQELGSFPAIIRDHLILNAQAAEMPDPVNLPFNANQRETYEFILSLIQYTDSLEPKFIFVDGPGGTGKTFLFNALLDSVRRTGSIALAVAHSGTAATLLKGGRTAHSTFKIPIELSSESMCNITPTSDTAELIRQAKIIIWDEASMISRDQIGTVDRTLRDIMKVQNPILERVPLGGKLFVFGGDFRQVLPVIPGASRAEIVSHWLNNSPIWAHVKILKLTVNMRVQQALSLNNSELAAALQDFASYILSIGNGSATTIENTDLIRIPDDMILPGSDLATLAEAIYGNFDHASVLSAQALTAKAILAPKNTDVNDLNGYLMDKFPGNYTDFYSADTVLSEDQALSYPVEYLNSMNPGSLPPHHLRLKIGSPIMMLRNLDHRSGVCNGTRLICKSFSNHLIEAEIATGPNVGETYLIPRIELFSNEKQTIIAFKRRQFPVRPAFAMTINKAQGQTLSSAGLYLPTSVFGYGQLYVAFSRVKTPDSIKILLEKEASTIEGQEGYYSTNVVYKEVL